jgi:hypothetical protein
MLFVQLNRRLCRKNIVLLYMQLYIVKISNTDFFSVHQFSCSKSLGKFLTDGNVLYAE